MYNEKNYLLENIFDLCLYINPFSFYNESCYKIIISYNQSVIIIVGN